MTNKRKDYFGIGKGGRDLIRQFIDTVLPIAKQSYYSQCGEDAILQHYFGARKALPSLLGGLFNRTRWQAGFYVDIGAFSPKRLSNTYFFYKNGWKGITVEPSSSASWMFRFARRRDVHLRILVDENPGDACFYDQGYSVTNAIDRKREYGNERTPLVVKSMRLETILREFLPVGVTIDLLSVDCEGNDLKVLKSNDWDVYRPSVICLEDPEWTPENKFATPISKFLEEHRYFPFAWTGASVIYQKYF